MANVALRIHPSIRKEGIPKILEADFSETKLIDAITRLLEPYPAMTKDLLSDSGLKPGLLVFADKVELTSMGLLNEIVNDDITIRIVPILHGG